MYSSWARGFASALLVRGCIPASTYRGIDVGKCRQPNDSHPIRSCSVLDPSSSHRMPHGAFLLVMLGFLSTMWNDVFIHGYVQKTLGYEQCCVNDTQGRE
jgi:hypothetical protein